jgi:hypothetical protein
MILKELDPFDGRCQEDVDARVPADRMVYLLRNHFRRSTEIDVMHGLRLHCGRSMARIDHLLLHAHGLIVLQRVDHGGPFRVNADGQWTRLDTPSPEPVASPVTHAYIQALLLKDFLDRHVRQPGFFDHLGLDVLVVLHDQCSVHWPTEGAMEEVCMREEVFDRLCRCIGRGLEGHGGESRLGPSERRTMGRFLSRSHRPLDRMP